MSKTNRHGTLTDPLSRNPPRFSFPCLPPHQSVCTARDGNKAWLDWCHVACVRSSGQSSERLHPIALWCSRPTAEAHSLKCSNRLHLVLTSLWNTIYLSCPPSAHYFAHTTDPAESFQTIRLNYGRVHVQVITHGVVATWELPNTQMSEQCWTDISSFSCSAHLLNGWLNSTGLDWSITTTIEYIDNFW